MPAVRFSRDKRGYEYIYLVHTPVRRGKPGRTRVLYCYRTPPGVRIGRPPFDPDVQKLIEQQNPGLTFDWATIVNTPFPPPDMTEYWRERRRAEKAARQERRAQEADDTPAASRPLPEGITEPAQAEEDDEESADQTATDTVTGDAGPEAAASPGAQGDGKKRRRRRGGRRRRTGEASDEVTVAGADEQAPASTEAAQDREAIEPSEPDAPASEEE